ncbi:MAG: hypothetical protein CUN55_13215 [Phototrophicales bacterium]|nr:MAG: hypothetical protein CUN55_13215 [Phototrophicales bacterium]
MMQRYDFNPANDDKPILHLAHANGFPPQVYHDLIGYFSEEYHAICFPARPLWENPPDYQTFDNWHIMADDLIAAFDQEGLKNVVGIGHSMGGTATLLAALKRPDLFSAIIVLDPVLFPRTLIRLMTVIPHWLPHPEIPLVKVALRRKRAWATPEEAFERFRSRTLFKHWSDETIWRYIEGITQPDSINGGITLRYTPEWEAQIYATSMYSLRGWWKWLKQIQVPTAAIQGGNTDTFLPAAVSLWRKTRPDFPVEVLEGQGHLFPIDAPAETAQMIKALLKRLK